MLNEIIAFASISSHSLDVKGLAAAAEYAKGLFSPLADETTSVPLPSYKNLDNDGNWKEFPLGSLLTFKKLRKNAPVKLLLVGHYDTVYETLFPIRQEGDYLYGPGVADMKGGIILMLNLLSWLENSDLKEKISWEVCLNPDEEIGSPSSGPLLQQAAFGKTLGLVFEPSLPTGATVNKRPGSKTLVIEAFGKGGHAGRDAHVGKNALVALSEVALYFASLQNLEKGITVNPGWMKGGVSANVIPDKAVLVVNIRGEPEPFEEQLEAISQKRGVRFVVTQKNNRPPRHCLPKTLQYIELLGLPSEPSFGVSDSNLLEAVGLPTLDGLGPTGFNLHSKEERLFIPSLLPRLEVLKKSLTSITNRQI